MLLDSKKRIVTGAASPRGIGKATAKALAAQGARVVILDLRKEDAESAARDLGEGHLGLACDVTDKAACVAAARAVVEKYGRVDGSINNAGITQPLKTMDIEAANFDAIIDVNLRGTLYMSQAVIPQMREQKAAASSVCRPFPRNAAAASSAARTTAPPKQVYSASLARWRVNSARTTSASTRSPASPFSRHHGRQAHDRDARRRHQRHSARPTRRCGGRRERLPIRLKRPVDLPHGHHARRQRRHVDSLKKDIRRDRGG